LRLPLSLTLFRSRSLRLVVGFGHGLALMAVLCLDQPPTVILALSAFAVGSLYWFLRTDSPVGLVLRSDGQLILRLADGSESLASVHPATTVFAGVVVLLARSADRRWALTLPVDTLGADGHRQLRLWLRWRISAVTA